MMKKTSILGLFVALVLFGGNVSAWAATNPISVPLPAGSQVLSNPPVVGSPIWQADSAHYYAGRTLRRTPRSVTSADSVLLKLLGVTKKVGSVITVDSLIAKKREPYLSWLKTYGADPSINLPLGDTITAPTRLGALDKMCENLKEYHTNLWRVRLRPYHYFPGDMKKTATTAENSYPSGHGYFTGVFGACMYYIDPKHVTVTVKNNDSFGEQRLILGAHWASDIVAGRTLGNLAFALALRDANFKQLLEEAEKELSGKYGTELSYTDISSHFDYLPNCKDVSIAPSDMADYAWKSDSLMYLSALALREDERGQLAQKDADYTTWLSRFSAADVMGVDITSKYVLPNLHEMVDEFRAMAEYAAETSRNHMRVIPNAYFAQESTTASAVSADAYMVWTLGLALAYIDTEHADKIARTALDIADAGYILGNYWQSEIENSEKMGSIGFAMAMRNPHFRALADAAIQELAYAKTIKVVPDDKGDKPLTEAQTTVNEVLAECLNTTKDLQVSRTIYCDGYYNTLCLPFAISAEDWADESKNPLAAGTLKIFKSASIDDNDVLNIEIEDADSIKAGVPYLIKFAEGDDIVNPLFKNITVTTITAGDTATDAMDCKGLFAPDTIVKEANAQYLILGEKNTLYKATKEDANDYIRGFRAYFKVNDTPAGVAIRKAKSAQLTEKTMPTGDSPIHRFTNSPIYKLIDDGEVIIIRDGVKYGIDGMVR